MGIGVAVCQPAAPTIVGEWFPARIGFATAIYVNGLLVGETLSAAFTIPYVLPLLKSSWEWSFVFWSLPVLATGRVARSVHARDSGACRLAPRMVAELA